mgnify:CR=1 FL=1
MEEWATTSYAIDVKVFIIYYLHVLICRQLESDLHQAQQLPKKHHISGPEMKDNQLVEADEDLLDVKAVRKEGLVTTPQKVCQTRLYTGQI